MIGVKNVPPMPPRLEIVMLAPCRSGGDNRRARARSLHRRELDREIVKALGVDVADHRHDQAVRRVGGTPMWK